MDFWRKWVNPLQLIVLMLFLLPFLAIFGLGIWWLWQGGYLLYWLIVVAVCSAAAYGSQFWAARRNRTALNELLTEPDADWSPRTNEIWQQVEQLADHCEPLDWPLDNIDWVTVLGKRTLDTVARCYFPQAERPILELTVPHTLLIIEQASRDLRQDVINNIPFSHRLTIGDCLQANRWKMRAEKLYNFYRVGRVAINPVNALLGEFWRYFRERSFGLARGEFHRWFLRAYIRKVGYYAIDLYSGHPPLTMEDATVASLHTPVPPSSHDLAQVRKAQAAVEEPLRILVLGKSNAGKSSLINALYGKLFTPTDILPGTTSLFTPALLIREGFTQALIFDSPGIDSIHFSKHEMLQTALEADLIIWVTAANRSDRKGERNMLDALRIHQTTHLHRRPPPLLVAVSHIDLLRPFNEWYPPYDLNDQTNAKANNIREAVETIATDLDVPVTFVIPLCLKENKRYNVEDAFWTTILAQQDNALRVRLLRCQTTRKKSEDWELLRKQLLNSGRFLWNLPDTIKNRIAP
ncbi:MAG: GTPase domain-containing protein [Nitrosomonas sp.]|nr:GTPase domain-containing protein [Nitrosomonas sp.]